VKIGPGFAVLSVLAGLPFGRLGAVMVPLCVASVLLAQELPRALFARAYGRSSHISFSMAGGNTHVLGRPLQGLLALGFSTVGSVANVAAAGVLWCLAEYGASGELATLLREFSTCHLLWGLGQALPLIPFRAGEALHRRLPGHAELTASPRYSHALGSVLFLGLGTLAIAKTTLWLLPLSALAAAGALVTLVRIYRASAAQQRWAEVAAIHAALQRARAEGPPRVTTRSAQRPR
jgi:hypothetical protein